MVIGTAEVRSWQSMGRQPKWIPSGALLSKAAWGAVV